MDFEIKKIAVLGAGSWGTALANHLAGKGYDVSLWMRDSELSKHILANGINNVYLPEVKLSENLKPTCDLAGALNGTRFVVSSIPSHGIRAVFSKAAPLLAEEALIVNTAKGIEVDTGLTVSGIFSELGLNNTAILSGPSFAKEVCERLPCAIVAASENDEAAKRVQSVFNSSIFRVYTSSDVIGVELGGALKNVMAIASGIIDGLKLGLNARAALITRGLAETTRLGARMGAKPDTFYGLSGLGDLVLTCTGALSRNLQVGRRLGEGKTLTEIMADMKMVAEGVKTSKAVKKLANEFKVEMPITEEVNNILYKDKSPKKAVMELMSRELKEE
ncbi:MAG: NAD(P)H-dependent glycerol-3-phosphate dehydrogenase [Thermodesulfobacteriota bacterium]